MDFRRKIEQALDIDINSADREGLTAADIDFAVGVLMDHHRSVGNGDAVGKIFVAPAGASLPSWNDLLSSPLFVENHPQIFVIFRYCADTSHWTVLCWAAHTNYGEYYDPLWSSSGRFHDAARVNRLQNAAGEFREWARNSPFRLGGDFSVVEGKMKVLGESWSSGFQALDVLSTLMYFAHGILASNKPVFPYHEHLLGLEEPAALNGRAGFTWWWNEVATYEERHPVFEEHVRDA